MAAIDNDRVTGQYMIDGVPVADPQLPYKFELNVTGNWWRNMEASRCGELIANMKKIYWTYNGLEDPYANEILSIIFKKVIQGIDTFQVTSYVNGLGVVTDKYYIGQPFSYEVVGPGLYKFDCHWIQDEGKKQLGGDLGG